MYSKRKYNHTDDSDISLRPTWLGVIDWKKGCNIIDVNTDLQGDIQSSEDVNKDNIGFNDKIINLDFLYYNERVEFIKKNSVFLKPQYQVVDTIEQYMKLYKNKDKNKNKDIDIDADIITENTNENDKLSVIANVNEIQNDLNTFQTQKKRKNLSSKYSLASLLLSPGKSISNTNDMNDNMNDTKKQLSKYNNNNNNNSNKNRKNKKNNNDNDNYSDSEENVDSTSEPEFNYIIEPNRY